MGMSRVVLPACRSCASSARLPRTWLLQRCSNISIEDPVEEEFSSDEGHQIDDEEGIVPLLCEDQELENNFGALDSALPSSTTQQVPVLDKDDTSIDPEILHITQLQYEQMHQQVQVNQKLANQRSIC